MHEPADVALDALVPRLRQFVVVAREEHLTRAAELLGVPQPTLSRSIARLEAELGVPLFTRPGRSIRLTRHGRYLLEAAERTVATLSGALEGLANEADASSGRVALGFLHTLGGETVPRLLKDFRARHPLVRFALVQDSSQGLLTRLREGEIDLCLTAPLPQSPDVQTHSLYEQRIDLYVPAGHALAARHRDGMPLAAAADEDFIVMEPGYGLRTITDDLCRAAGFEPRITFEGEEADTARGLVGAGLGVSLLPTTASSLADPAVVALRITAPKAARTVGLAWPDDRPLTAPAAAFRDFALTRATHLPQHTSHALTAEATLFCGADNQVGQVVAESRRRLAVFATAGRLVPVSALGRPRVQEFVEFGVDIAIRVGVIMRSDKQDARSAWRIERDNDPKRSA